MLDYKRKVGEFNKRFEINSNLEHQIEFDKFKNRLFNYFPRFDYYFGSDEIKLFCNILGIPESWDLEYVKHGSTSQKVRRSNNITNALKKATTEKAFFKILQAMLMLVEQKINKDDKYEIVNKIQEAVFLSNTNVTLKIIKEELILFPKGEKHLDETLVDKVLKFLNDDSNKHFIDSLKFYQMGANKNYIKSAESLRRTSEEFLRYKLKNSKGLKENINELQKKLKLDNRDSIIRNNIFTTLGSLDQYFNNNSKHNDGDIKEGECEYLIYQTAVLLRYIDNVI